MPSSATENSRHAVSEAGSAQVLDEIALGVTVVVRNTGSRTGREVAQAYVEPHSLERGRPLRTLAAFATVTAKPGRAAEARLAIPAWRSRVTTRRQAAGSGRPASSPSASPGLRLTCACPYRYDPGNQCGGGGRR